MNQEELKGFCITTTRTETFKHHVLARNPEEALSKLEEQGYEDPTLFDYPITREGHESVESENKEDVLHYLSDYAVDLYLEGIACSQGESFTD